MMPSQSVLSHPTYRPDIDGLRALAVVAVVAFHAFPNWFKSGFIGVDIFFVISGFLISTIIFESLDKGQFSFSVFYARRIRRIFPALILVLIVCYILGWMVLLADEYSNLGKHIAAGAGFSAHLVFWGEAGYFAGSADTKPLLHLWSLGIEEQFYLIWPCVVWLVWQKKYNILIITLAAFALSFSINLSLVDANPVSAFYLPQARCWELLCGSVLAYLQLQRKNQSGCVGAEHNPVVLNLISISGLVLLALGFVQISKAQAFPGAWALLPVAGTFLIIYAGAKAWLNRYLLSNRLLVWFGIISFPLYLWHWPLLSFARIIEGGYPSKELRAGIVLLSIVLAWLTYKLVECPIRFGKLRNSVSILLVLLVAIGFLGLATYYYKGVASRAVVSENQHIGFSGFDGGDGGYFGRGCGLGLKESLYFAFCGADKRGNVKYALLGDSKAGALYTGLVRTSSASARWMFIGGSSASGAPIPIISAEPEFAPHQMLTHLAVAAIAENKQIETVLIAASIRSLFQISDAVVSGNLGTYDYRYLKQLNSSAKYDKVYAGLADVIERFAQKNKKVVLLVDNPALPEARVCAGRKTSIGMVNNFLGLTTRGLNKDCYLSLAEFNDDIVLYKQLLRELRTEFTDVVDIFDATAVYCDVAAGVCGPSRHGRLLYSYTDHISDYAAGLVGAELNSYLNDQTTIR